MKVLFYGGQKSGKSHLAEEKILQMATTKPFYVATYDNSFNDCEMQEKIDLHRQRRLHDFITLEEPCFLDRVIEDDGFYLIDCLSMWILNILEKEIDHEKILQTLLHSDAHIVFVLNDVNRGIIPDNPLSRRYVDLTGIIGQEVAACCDEVYEVVLGLPKRLK